MAQIAAWEFEDKAAFDGSELYAEVQAEVGRTLRSGTLELTFTPRRLTRATVLAHGVPGRDAGAFAVVLSHSGVLSLACTDRLGAPFRLKTAEGFVAEGERVQITLSWGIGGRFSVVNCDRVAERPNDPTCGHVDPLPLRARCDLRSRSGLTFGAAAGGLAPFLHGTIHRVTLSDSVDAPTVSPPSARIHHVDFGAAHAVRPRRVEQPAGGGAVRRPDARTFRRAGPSGMRIATAEGDLPLIQLASGTEVLTRDNGLQPLRWTGRAELGWTALQRQGALRPVVIRKGYFGPNLPEADLILSPAQRLLVPAAALQTDEAEAAHGLLPAGELRRGSSLPQVEAIGVTYVHFFCDRTEVVQINGVWVEILNPQLAADTPVEQARQRELFDLHPALQTEAGSARG